MTPRKGANRTNMQTRFDREASRISRRQLPAAEFGAPITLALDIGHHVEWSADLVRSGSVLNSVAHTELLRVGWDKFGPDMNVLVK